MAKHFTPVEAHQAEADPGHRINPHQVTAVGYGVHTSLQSSKVCWGQYHLLGST
jgi:hypothetical protein